MMATDGNSELELESRLNAVQDSMASAAHDAGRDIAGITTIVVTKFHPLSVILKLHALGVRDFGENRHQEACNKAVATSELTLRWHFVGQLQSKKARQVRAYSSVIHSIDRTALVEALASEANMVDCFIQLNLTDDPGRGGVHPAGLESLAEQVLSAPGLHLLGVMAVAPLGEEPRSAFARVRAASERLVAVAPEATAISAGMSADYREAILEGATHLRIGSAITGKRPVDG